MDLTFTTEEEKWRAEVRDFLDRELPPESAFDTEFCEDESRWEFAFDFTKKVAAEGWIGLTWPTEYGGLGRTTTEHMILFEELTRRDAPLINHIGFGLAAGSLLYGGTDEQKRRFLPRIARFEELWVEGLTEPDSGSDLASLRTRAVRDGSDWIITGQKTYTTWGHRGEVMFLAARTNPDEPRHRGISIFCLPLDLKGVSFSPLYNLGGGRQNHTFLDEVRVPTDMLIGEEGNGWACIMNAFYGGGGGGGRHVKLELKLEQMVRHCVTTRRRGQLLIDDPRVRSELAELALMAEAEKLLSYEALGDAVSGSPPAYGGALGVVVSKEAQPRFAQICMNILGPLGQLAAPSPWSPLEGAGEAWYRQSFANHAGGTPQVKRMVLATRGLGLPR